MPCSTTFKKTGKGGVIKNPRKGRGVPVKKALAAATLGLAAQQAIPGAEAHPLAALPSMAAAAGGNPMLAAPLLLASLGYHQYTHPESYLNLWLSPETDDGGMRKTAGETIAESIAHLGSEASKGLAAVEGARQEIHAAPAQAAYKGLLKKYQEGGFGPAFIHAQQTPYLRELASLGALGLTALGTLYATKRKYGQESRQESREERRLSHQIQQAVEASEGARQTARTQRRVSMAQLDLAREKLEMGREAAASKEQRSLRQEETAREQAKQAREDKLLKIQHQMGFDYAKLGMMQAEQAEKARQAEREHEGRIRSAFAAAARPPGRGGVPPEYKRRQLNIAAAQLQALARDKILRAGAKKPEKAKKTKKTKKKTKKKAGSPEKK